MLHSNEMSALV